MSSEKTHPTCTSWCIWYHNPHDKNWALNSFDKLYEFDSLESFWDLFQVWDDHLPHISDGMFFLMRKVNDNYIYPLWEDKNNRNGGFWSFKVDKTTAEEIWLNLSICLVSEDLCINEDYSLINGISISPKKNFCIIKIWNNNINKSDFGIIKKFSDKLDYTECMYKCHNDNIANDKIKLKKYKYCNKNGNGNGNANGNANANANGNGRTRLNQNTPFTKKKGRFKN